MSPVKNRGQSFSLQAMMKRVVVPISDPMSSPGPIPLLLILMTWRVWPHILENQRDYGLLVVAVCALMASYALVHRSVWWLLSQAASITLSLLFLGVDMYAWLLVLPLVLLLLWVFLRWPQLGHAWSFRL